MSSKWIAAAVTTVLATGVLTADVSGATTRPQNDESRTSSSAPVPEPDTAADSSPSAARVSIGPLGRVLTSVDALIDAATPSTGTRSPDTLQERFTAVDTAARELRAAYRARSEQAATAQNPSVPFARTTVRQSPPPSIADIPKILPAEDDEPRILPAEADEPRTLPAKEESTQTQPARQDLRGALSTLLEHAEALVEKARDPEADEQAVREAARPISQDALAVVTSTVEGIKRP